MESVDLRGVDQVRAALDRRLSDIVGSLSPGPMREALGDALEGGKRIRPLLSMAACAAAGGRYLDALDVAAAVELLHCASLIHDDIMDHSTLRRGKPTLHSRHGISASILSGDMLIALAFRTLHSGEPAVEPEILEEFSRTFILLCEGQGDDIQFSGPHIDPHGTHQDTVRKKTAELLAGSLAMGARIATDDQSIVKALRTFGLYLGLAYQAKDDLLDTVGTEEQTGKSCGTDRKNGRLTYVSLAGATANGVSAVQAEVSSNTDAALRALEQLPPSPARDTLASLALMLVQRNL